MFLYRYNVIVSLVLTLILKGVCYKIDSKSSIVFVIDIMGRDIEKVKSSANAIFNTVTNSSQTSVETYVLVLFDYPNARSALVTTDREKFNNALQSTTLDGSECITSIETALDTSPRGSYVYIFTDASADDFDQFEEVRRIAREKEFQVEFVRISEHEDQADYKEDYTVYSTKLEEVTSVQVFKMQEEINMIKVNSRVKRYLGGSPDDPNISADLTGPSGKPIDKDALEKIRKKTVPSSDEPNEFHHGFSTKLVSSLDDTDFNPIPETKNHLYIKLIKEKTQLVIVKLFDKDYSKLMEFPLKLQDTDQKLYTTEHFYPPRSRFRIIVKGIDTETHREITLFGPLIQEAELLMKIKPTINIRGENIITVDYDGELQLHCTVDAYPEPIFTWRDSDRREIPSILDRVPPYKYNRILKLKNLTKSKSYECYAENNEGSDSQIVQVQVGPKPYIKIQKPKDQVLKYGAKGFLHCKVISFPPAKISWIFDEQKKALVLRGDIVISPDYSTVTIKEVNEWTRGTYICQIVHLGRSYVKYATINLATRLPTYEHFKLDLREGENAHLRCSLQGKTYREIRWYRKLALDLPHEFKEMPEKKDQTSISITRADSKETGDYKCEAGNTIKKAERINVISVFVNSEPTVKLLDTGKKMVVERNTEVTIKCVVHGVPTPEVVWLYNGAPVKTDPANHITITSDHILRFKAVVDPLDRTGKYTCKAENKLGMKSESVEVTVTYLDVTSPSKTEFELNRGQNKYFTCRSFVKGVPKPTLKWEFINSDGRRTPISPKKPGKRRKINKLGDLKIAKIQVDQQGSYICVASNTGHEKSIAYKIDVLFPPKMIKKATSYHAVEGDRLLGIYCDVTGNPEPTVNWEMNGFPVTKEKIYFDGKWLKIQNVEVTDAGKYDCSAENKLSKGAVTELIDVFVDPYPKDRIKRTITSMVEKGSNKLIECPITYIHKDTLRWYKDKKMLEKNTLNLYNAQPSHAGTYTCRVSKDSLETENANVEVIVGYRPTFVTDAPKKFQKFHGLQVSLNCQVSADPLPTVTWMHNGKNKRYSGMIYKFRMDSKSVGEFKCIIRNAFGSIERTFELIFKEFTECGLQIGNDVKNQPLMTTSGTLPKFKTTDGLTTIPKLENVEFSCPARFTMFEETDLIATCYGGTTFFAKGKEVDYADIKCKTDIKPTYIVPKIDKKKIPCLGEKTKTAKITFNFGTDYTIEAIEYCLDRDYNAIYAKYTMRFPAGYLPKNTDMWDDSKLDYYSCDKQGSRFSGFLFDATKCCFAKRHLVNPSDLFPGPLQRATYNRLNIVPHWSTCNSENWDEVGKKIRGLAESINSDLIIYTGISEHLTVYNKHGKKVTLTLKRENYISTYLWKVVQYPAAKSSVAIVQINVPEVLPSEVDLFIRCNDICHELPWMRGTDWRHVGNGYTYCCELEEFMHTFDFFEIKFEPYFDLLIR